MSRLLAGLICLVLCGCGGTKPPPVYHLSGTVTFNGQPVPVGTINFDPAPGSSVIPGYAVIQQGKYDTRTGGVGHGGGKIIIRINGFDGIAQEGEMSQGTPLFPETTTTSELPAKDDTRNFELPLKP
jgi:hypothetical protein